MVPTSGTNTDLSHVTTRAASPRPPAPGLGIGWGHGSG